MIEEFKNLAEIIKKKSAGYDIIYIPNPGNFGDGLIRYSTKQFLNDNKIPHHELNIGYSNIKLQLLPRLLGPKKFFFIYGGGGAWCEYYDFGRKISEFISKFTDRLIVLPSTYSVDTSNIKGTMFRRDKTKSIEYSPNSIFCHDMAFYTTVRKNPNFANFEAPKHEIGYLLRTDEESRLDLNSLPANNRDISTEGDHMDGADDFLRIISQYETIYTDRLHVCIGSCIVGRKVKLLTGSYFKIKAIYESSLEPFFSDNVSLIEKI